MLPANMRILVHGTATVLGSTAVVSGLVGLATSNPLVALNTMGFIGSCALASTIIFYSIALERIGLRRARQAAGTLVGVLAGSAVFMTLVAVALLSRSRFLLEASRVGLHSMLGVVVLVVLAAALVVTYRDR